MRDVNIPNYYVSEEEMNKNMGTSNESECIESNGICLQVSIDRHLLK